MNKLILGIGFVCLMSCSYSQDSVTVDSVAKDQLFKEYLILDKLESDIIHKKNRNVISQTGERAKVLGLNMVEFKEICKMDLSGFRDIEFGEEYLLISCKSSQKLDELTSKYGQNFILEKFKVILSLYYKENGRPPSDNILRN
jgi:hypothetical protein